MSEPLSGRFLALNEQYYDSLAIDHKDEKNVVTKGLWNSLSEVLGAGSFDFANSTTRNVVFHSSGTSFGNDHSALIKRVQDRYAAAQTALQKIPDPTCFLTVPAAGFGFEIQRLHRKKAQDIFR